MDINAGRFQFFQAQDERQFLVRTFTVAPEVVRPCPGSGKRTRTTREEFLASLDENGRAVFGKLLDFAGSKELPIRWGISGFSVNVDVEGTSVAVFFCSPASLSKQSIYTNRSGINRKTKVPEDEITRLWSTAEATGLFKPAVRELKCLIDRAFTDAKVAQILSWCDEMAGTITKYGLKEEAS